MPNIFVNNNFYQGTSQACIVDITPPTFAGLNFLDVESRGQIRAGWAAATDPNPPIRYEVYAKASTATGLFNVANIVGITSNLSFDIYTMPDGSFLQNGVTYHVGVRALDGLSNRDANLISSSVISTGILTSIDTYEASGAFSIGPNNMFQGTMWVMKNKELGLTNLGTASYVIYDKNGDLVSGMSETGITADSNGQFQITPVESILNDTLDHYLVKVTVVMDSEARNSYVAILEPTPTYEVFATYAINEQSELHGTFWVYSNGVFLQDLSRLGTASLDIYDIEGNLLPGSQTNISPDANGFYFITPVPGIEPNVLLGVKAKVTIMVDGLPRVGIDAPEGIESSHEVFGTFSINALNQLQGTLWGTAEGSVAKGAALGTASYTVYNAAGVAVSGLSQSGITADANGQFIITPVSAALLTDLTHYTVKIVITIHGLPREGLTGFTLLGT